MIVFGPVPSRRLGRSLGINNIPPKHCSYSCLYCQVGKTPSTEIEPRFFYQPLDIFNEVKNRVEKLQADGQSIDYLTFVPDGEPTLDINLGESINLLRRLSIKIAIISNASLIERKDVREALMLADWVSLKIDSVDETTWRHLNRPDKALNLDRILSSILSFKKEFDGFLATETMLIKGVNTDDRNISSLTEFLRQLNPNKVYLAVPTRPTAEQHADVPDADELNRIYQTVARTISGVELLIGYEGNEFTASGDPVQNLLSITSVHPMRKDAVEALLKKTDADWKIIDELVAQHKLREIKYHGNIFYLRSF